MATRPGVACAALALLAACASEPPPDAYGTFEAEDVVVAAQVSGQLERFTVEEGTTLAREAVVAVIDTVQLALERDQARAQQAALIAREREATEQLAALRIQREIAERGWQRIQRLRAGEAATAMQADQAEREVRVLGAQVEAAQAALGGLAAERTALEARIGQVTDRLAHASVTNPVAGTVLTTFVRTGEVIQPGQALYRIANLDTLTLRAYLTGDQLGAVRLGDHAEVRVDDVGGGVRATTGVVTWISAQAEFTPTPVQTRDERATLVYAVKLRVANPDGRLKVGMPADLSLAPTATEPADR